MWHFYLLRECKNDWKLYTFFTLSANDYSCMLSEYTLAISMLILIGLDEDWGPCYWERYSYCDVTSNLYQKQLCN